MLALDVARVEAGLLLIDVDFFSSKKALIESQKYTPVRDGPRPAGQPDKGRFIGQQALRASSSAGRRGRSSAWRSTGPESSRSTSGSACRRPSAPPPRASRCRSTAAGRQVGRATTTTWSPVLKKMIALATVDRPHFAEGTVARDRGDRRGRAPPRRRDGRADAVLQPAAEDGDAAEPETPEANRQFHRGTSVCSQTQFRFAEARRPPAQLFTRRLTRRALGRPQTRRAARTIIRSNA